MDYTLRNGVILTAGNVVAHKVASTIKYVVAKRLISVLLRGPPGRC